MFSNKSECIKIGDEVYLFKNYISADMANRYANILNTLEEKDFLVSDSGISWYDSRVSRFIPEALDLWESLSDLVYPDYFLGPKAQFMRSIPGQEGMYVHRDSPGKEHAQEVNVDDPYGTCHSIDYGMVAYLGEFTGGEIYYPYLAPDGTKNLNGWSENCFIFKPEQGDIVIHGSGELQTHGTYPVTSGTRYAFNCFLSNSIDADSAKYFKYKSENYFKQIGDRSKTSVKNWLLGDIDK